MQIIVPIEVEVADTDAPTSTPSLAPTPQITAAATPAPTVATGEPTKTPTAIPTAQPTAQPTKAPTKAPTKTPTKQPTKAPTLAPTKNPTKAPTRVPTANPTASPTQPEATAAPTVPPTLEPTSEPTMAPTRMPTTSPTPVSRVTENIADGLGVSRGSVAVNSQRRQTYTPPARATAAPTPVPKWAYENDYDDDSFKGGNGGDDDGGGARGESLFRRLMSDDSPRRRLATDGSVTVETSTVTVTGVTCDQVYAIVNTPESKLMNDEVTSGIDAHGVRCTPAVSITAATNYKTCPGVLLVTDSMGNAQSTIWCSGRGACDHTSGVCECYTGYDGSTCSCPPGQVPDATNPTLCRLSTSTIESASVVNNGAVVSSSTFATETTPSPTPMTTVSVPPVQPGDSTTFAKLAMDLTLNNVNFDDIVWGEVKLAIVSGLNRLLGYEGRRLSQVTESMVDFIERSQVGTRVDVKFEAEMEKNQAMALIKALKTDDDAKNSFQLAVAQKLKEINPATYASVAVEVGGAEVVETSTTITTAPSTASNLGMIVGVVAVMLLVIGIIYFVYQRMHHAAGGPEGKWKEETETANNSASPGANLFSGELSTTKSLSRHESQPVNLSDAGMSRKTSRFAMHNPLAKVGKSEEVAAL